MSKVVHPKPVWGWSVVLLSTLLLSPTAGVVALRALAQAYAASLTDALPQSGQSSASPRRADDAWVRRARNQGPLLSLRLDTHPDTVAILWPSQTVLLVPDDAPVLHAPSDAPPLISSVRAATPSRAPPFVSFA